ncbi:hypothetical protein M3Y97_00939300 [Aphelenchoides bicaudatus]|nr:hypothetical protein M3Y97_00939300 [Aphelenchoides bicaudatus]
MNVFSESITEVKKYIESTKQVESNNTICDVFSRLSFPITNTRIILFVNELSLSDIEDGCVFALRRLVSSGNQLAFVPLSDKFNQTVLKHYFDQATIIQWDVVNNETPKDWEKQFNAFYNCDQTVTTVGKPNTTPKNPANSYPPCNTSPITIAFDKSSGLTGVEFQQQKDFLINHVFQKWTKFDRLRVFSFAGHVYSESEEQVEEKPDLCNFFETCVVNYDNENNHFVVFLSKLEGTDFEKRDPKTGFICEEFIDDVFKGIQLTFVLLHDRIDPDVLRKHIPTVQFIKMNVT